MTPRSSTVAISCIRPAALKNKGIISEQEFQAKKN